MPDHDLFDAVARNTGEDSHEIARRGFVLTGPEDANTGPEPGGLLDLMMVDLTETGTVEGDALGCGCREPFFASELKARRRRNASSRAGVNASPKKRAARAS